MNSSNAKQFLPLVQALAEGKTIQIKNPYKGGVWEDAFNVEFSFGPEHYRVKPEPQVLYVVRCKADPQIRILTTSEKSHAENCLSGSSPGRASWELVTFTENL